MMQSLYEKHRPTCFEQVIGQEKAIKALRRIQARGGFGGRAYFLSGASGVGKTSIARLIAQEVAGALATNEINARDVDLEYVQTMERQFSTRVLAKDGEPTGRAWILNEMHLARKPIISRLLTTLEQLPAHVVVVFTTTNEGQKSLFEDYGDASPLLSRCMDIALTSKGLKELFAERASQIADQEGLNGKPIEWYRRLAMDKRNNMRAMLSEIETGAALDS